MPITFQNQNKKGKIVVANDEWTLSTEGFTNADAGATAFTRSLARYFLEGRKLTGNFLMGTTNPHIDSTEFRACLTQANHTLSAPVNSSQLNREAMGQILTTYDGIIVGGGMIPDTSLLTEFVLRGGNVFLVAGLNATEATTINDTLNNFGVTINTTANGGGRVVPVSGDHELFDEVSQLYINGGFDLQLAQPAPNYVYSNVTVPDPTHSGWFLYSIIEVPTVKLAGLESADMPEWNQYQHHTRWEDGFLSFVLGYNEPPSDSADGHWHTTSDGNEIQDKYGTGSCRLWVKNMSTIGIRILSVRLLNSLTVTGDIEDYYDIYYCTSADQSASSPTSTDRMDLFRHLTLASGASDHSDFHWGLQRDAYSNSTAAMDLSLSLAALPNYRLDYPSKAALRSPFKFVMPPVNG